MGNPHISTIIEMMEWKMPKSFSKLLERLLTVTSQQLELCCHREVGNPPLEMLRRDAPRWGRLR